MTANKLRCTACMVGMCLTRARSDIADELSWYLPFCGYATSRKNPLNLFFCKIPEPFLTLPQRKPNPSVCSGDLPLLALALIAKARSSKPSVAGDTNPPPPSPAPPSSTATRGVPNNSEQLWSLLQGALASAFYRQFHRCCTVFGALNVTPW